MQKKERVMKRFAAKSTQTIVADIKKGLSAIADWSATFAAAAGAATALENHRQPAPADLRRLGLDGVKFRLNG